uniref:Uncharacterized protein n=1 Tax=Rhizophora mucronata TaxID=61149 RepID=A0A2P2J8L0_RHIMU
MLMCYLVHWHFEKVLEVGCTGEFWVALKLLMWSYGCRRKSDAYNLDVITGEYSSFVPQKTWG